MPPVVAAKDSGPTRTESGSASTHFVDVAVVVDFSALSDDYKMVDAKKLQAAVKAGIRDIKGVKIEKKPITKILTS